MSEQQSSQSTQSTFTGRKRSRRTTFFVKATDVTARSLITLGGIGTIIAVCTVCVFLVWVVVPLFLPGEVLSTTQLGKTKVEAPKLMYFGIDEYKVIGWTLDYDGNLVVFRADTGEVLDRQSLNSDEAKLTAMGFSLQSDDSDSRALVRHMVFGYSDGSVRLARAVFESSFLEQAAMPEDMQDMKPGDVAAYDGGMVEVTPEGQFRVQKFTCTIEDPIKMNAGNEESAAIVLLDMVQKEAGPVVSSLDAAGRLRIASIRARKNLLTNKITYRKRQGDLPFTPREGHEPKFLRITGLGDSVVLVYEDGHAIRFETKAIDRPRLAEELDLAPEEGAEITACKFVVGRTTLITGDSEGRLRAWFTTRPPEGVEPDHPSSDGTYLTRTHDLPFPSDSAITALGASERSRIMLVGDEDGNVGVLHVTTESVLTWVPGDGSGSVKALAMAPKDDGLFATIGEQVWRWKIDLGYPEATFASLFTPVWYEGYNKPDHVWQSSSGTDDFEMKLGLVPLVFGTIKATIYSMLFGAPLALLAAIYTSEFLHPSVRTRVKPTIEMMASLPSVVLGFLAGLVIAPFVENWVPAMITTFVAFPLVILIGAHLWQLLPYRVITRYREWRLLALVFAMPVALGVSILLGPVIEWILFAGDLMLWLDGQIGSGMGGWVFLLLPLAGIIVAFGYAIWVNPWLRTLDVDRTEFAYMELGKFAVGLVLTLVVAAVLAGLLTLIGFDPRGPFVLGSIDMAPTGTYVQRNALVVGFAMGFAIIPIIYTIAEDALSSVPEHLRAASLGCGATPWQTATRVIIPVATSGLFSAIMIGLGRAVGETMIVLMAAGNTPVLEMNIFNGFRTLSANIAVEMPEAVKNSTHYRTLFLAALVLFTLTFLLNTVAELIRLRFRARNRAL